jgi:hypothetical protein
MVTLLEEMRRLYREVNAKVDDGGIRSFTTSIMSPTAVAYKNAASAKMDGWLMHFCALKVVKDSKRRLPTTDSSADGIEWDCRLKVERVGTGDITPLSPLDPTHMVVYGKGPYSVVDVDGLHVRKLSPEEGSAGLQFFAVFEYTMRDRWLDDITYERPGSGKKDKRTSLLRALDVRLAKCVKRAAAAENKSENEVSVTDIVAVVGVVSQASWQDGVETTLSGYPTLFPHLHSMYRARRFIFIHNDAVVKLP